MRTTTSGAEPVTRRIGRTVVNGFVSPVAWDEEGRARAVCIVGENGDPVFVLPGGAGDEVINHLKRNVSATGRIQKRGRVRYLQVESVIRVPDPDAIPEQD